MDGLMMKYFVLKPMGSSPYSLASREAMRTYADNIEPYNSALAQDLRDWIQRSIEESATGIPIPYAEADPVDTDS